MQQPLISVIVPVYNVEKYLHQCLTSIVTQSYSNLEIILIDDGSTDTSPNICDAWKNKDARISVIHKVNGGLSSARNAGLDVATGRYVTFVDSDDWLCDNAISTMYLWMERYNCDLVMAGTTKAYDDGTTENIDDKYPAKIYSSQEALIDFLYHRSNLTSAAWNKLYSMDFFRGEKAIRFPNGLNSEDYYILAQIYYRMNAMYFNPMPLYYYRIRQGSICTTSVIDSHTYDKILIADKIQLFLKKINFSNQNAINYFIMQANHDVLFDLLNKHANNSDINKQHKRLIKTSIPIYFDISVPLKRKLKILIFSITPRLYHHLTVIKKNIK